MFSWNNVEREQTVLNLQYGLLHVQIHDIHIHHCNSSQQLYGACYVPGAIQSIFNTLTHLILSNESMK